MAEIEKTLDPDERIRKSQTQVQLSSSAGMPVGTLYLTNKRLIFQVSRGWSLLSIAPAGALVGKDITIPLVSIKNVKKGWPSVLTVQADKNYDFAVPSLQGKAWVEAVREACAAPLPPPPPSLPPQQSSPVGPPLPFTGSQPFSHKFCGNCGSPLKPENKFCVNCGSPVQ